MKSPRRCSWKNPAMAVRALRGKDEVMRLLGEDFWGLRVRWMEGKS